MATTKGDKMSVDLTFWRRNDNFLVRIHRDGAIEFLDHDIEYDLAMVEFGEPETYAIEVKHQWEEDPVWFFVRNFETTKEHLLLLSIDFSEHAATKLKKPFSKDNRIIEAIKTLRKFKNRNTNKGEIKDMLAVIYDMRSAAIDDSLKKVCDSIIYTSLNVIAYDTPGIDHSLFDLSTAAAIKSRGSHAEKERKWQIRRFVDCMASVQAGKPWPPLEATK